MPEVDCYIERYRPQFHFTAKENWLNDPNGCVFHDGEYHLFFQHNPAGREWGNMTWGHAVSTDLVRWHQLPSAIEPYDGGTIFSGSAVVDADNTTGFGRNGIPPLVAVFTHAKTPFGQALAFSTDRGRDWALYDEGRPVVPNQGLDDRERDPKVFWHRLSQRWVMVLWVRKGLARFFTSANLKHWTHASDFTGDEFYECPDLFELPLDDRPQDTRWVLLDANFRYWIGSFDGSHFRAEAGPLRGDWGGNFYAAQTWNNTGRRIVQIGWMRGGTYPGMPFNQQMSFPCELSLRTTPAGLRLFRMPVAEIERLRVASDSVSGRMLHTGEELQIGRCGDLFDIVAEIEASPDAAFSLRLHEVHIACSGGVIRCLGKEAAVHSTDNVIRLRVLLDRTSVEIFANGGEIGMSSCLLPAERETTVRCCAERGSVQVRNIAVHHLTSAWGDRSSKEVEPAGVGDA
ncbi:MAG: glycoside hydrolase family 32 protein [Verrucomicrobiae bacterium]|nr:glycoside hydrolase family 32 protein [Verrucomicrobiae bacterium]